MVRTLGQRLQASVGVGVGVGVGDGVIGEVGVGDGVGDGEIGEDGVGDGDEDGVDEDGVGEGSGDGCPVRYSQVSGPRGVADTLEDSCPEVRPTESSGAVVPWARP